MKLIRLVPVLTLLLLVLPSICAAQQDDGIAAIKTYDGYLLVWNQPGIYFNLNIKGKTVEPKNSSENVLFAVDRMFFQVQSVAITEFMKDDGKQRPDDKTILLAHRDWESDFIQHTLNKKITVKSIPQKLKNGQDALLWKYDMPSLAPELHSTAREQVYLTVVSKDHVILLNSAVEGATTADMAQTLLLDTISTLKVSTTPINVEELRKAILGQKP